MTAYVITSVRGNDFAATRIDYVVDNRFSGGRQVIFTTVAHGTTAMPVDDIARIERGDDEPQGVLL